MIPRRTPRVRQSGRTRVGERSFGVKEAGGG
jgi:hypothetical protein